MDTEAWIDWEDTRCLLGGVGAIPPAVPCVILGGDLLCFATDDTHTHLL